MPFYRLKKMSQPLLEGSIWRLGFSKYDQNPLGVVPGTVSPDVYRQIGTEARARVPQAFLDQVLATFGHLPDPEFVHDLAMTTQVVQKSSNILYLHGFLLYGAVRCYLDDHPELVNPLILETGTARGFSALCMAKALRDANRAGRILTVDVLPAESPIYWNCHRDADGPTTRLELLSPWQDLIEDYVVFLRGYTSLVLKQMGISRVNFAFLDSGHDYRTLKEEIGYVTDHQKVSDVIVCDDYAPEKYPGVVRAVDETLDGQTYTGTILEGLDGRAYAHCQRVGR